VIGRYKALDNYFIIKYYFSN